MHMLALCASKSIAPAMSHECRHAVPWHEEATLMTAMRYSRVQGLMSLDTHMQQTHMSCDEVLSSPTYRKSRHALPATSSLRLHTAASHAANTESHETNQYASKINLKCLARRPDMPPLAEQTKTLKNLHGLRQPVSFLVCARLWMS